MNWGIVTQDWRLKLAALGLAILMLGAVAFSQNPPTTGSVTIPLTYDIPPTLILINPPSTVTVTYSGPADVVKNVKASNLQATVDVTHAKPGTNVQLNVVARSTINELIVQNPPPINVTIDTYAQNVPLQVQVSASAAAGWSISKQVAECPGTPCVVHFNGPTSWTKNLTAFAAYPGRVNLSSIDSPNQPIQLQNLDGSLNLSPCRTEPCATLDTGFASIHIEAVPGSNSSTVTLLDSPPSHPPANGYRITAVTITPNTVVITGDPSTLGRIRTITLTAVDLTGRTSDWTVLVAIPYPDGVSGSVANASVKYSISPNPNVSPSPTPT